MTVDPEHDPYRRDDIDLERPSVARVYDYLLGGGSHWAVDREFADRVLREFPPVRTMALANRLFLRRAVRRLVAAGVRQFVDIGSGVPAAGSTHHAADAAAPGATRVVYVDNDPVAVAHSRVLLERGGAADRHAVVQADLRAPDQLWRRVAETGRLDLGRPLALLLVAVLHIRQPGPGAGEDLGPAAVARYRALLPPGSHLALSHITDEGVPPERARGLAALKKLYDDSGNPVLWRPRGAIRELFGDFTLVPPGITWTPLWHPEDVDPDDPEVAFSSPGESAFLAGVARKPA